MSRAILFLLALAVSGLGLASLLRPVDMAAIVEMPLPSAASRTDVRAIYGGLVTGVGVFLLSCALRRGMVRTGLMAAACVFGGAALGRFFGLMVEGFGQPLMVIVMLLEATGAGLATWGALIEPGLTRIGPPKGPAAQPSIPGASSSAPKSNTPASSGGSPVR
jgi:hypothetical protein